jgi:uncharacterized protein YyaL (SSP411 family)
MDSEAVPRRLNRLFREKSPYLLQHASNPVDWRPWGSEAFEAARRGRTPLFISIGYSACHWCHVMERESFEDEGIAALLNEHYIPIKVDREERPDVDKVYMEACAAMTGSGGWPLTILATPDGKPFFAGTYLPARARDGMPGLAELLAQAHEAWRTDPDTVAGIGERVAAALRREAAAGAPPPGEETVRAAFEGLRRAFDRAHGGFGGAPKFPSPHALTFLLRYARLAGDGEALAMAEGTLDAMRRGGIHDQLGSGFHRYSVDAGWTVPHFEKMLYDQAMLAVAYTEAYQATGDAAHEKTARGILDYVLRDLTAPGGAFCAAEDADSGGEEGRFYAWTPREVKAVLGDEEGGIACRYFGVSERGNLGGGASVLSLRTPLGAFARREGLDLRELEERLEHARKQLLRARARRVRPRRDDKVLADWNGLMIAALAKGAAAFDEPAYARAAARAAGFVLTELRRADGTLLHRFRDGEAAIPAFLDDYAFLSWGLLELYQATFDARRLAGARALAETMLRLFRDGAAGGFFFSPGDDLLFRSREAQDGAYPSGNAVAAHTLLRLGRLTGEAALEEKAEETLRAFAREARAAPAAHAHLLGAVLLSCRPARGIVVAGDPEREETRRMLRAAGRRFLPEAVIAFRPPGDRGEGIVKLAPYLGAMGPAGGRATAYVCSGGACAFPMTEQGRFEALLDAEVRR